jgi:hypothetical protein
MRRLLVRLYGGWWVTGVLSRTYLRVAVRTSSGAAGLGAMGVALPLVLASGSGLAELMGWGVFAGGTAVLCRDPGRETETIAAIAAALGAGVLIGAYSCLGDVVRAVWMGLVSSVTVFAAGRATLVALYAVLHDLA